MRNVENPYHLPLKKGYLKLQDYLEKMTFANGNPAGPLFILKNMDYSDNQTVNNISTDGSMSPRPTIVHHAKEEDKDANKATMKLFTGKNVVNQDAIPVS